MSYTLCHGECSRYDGARSEREEEEAEERPLQHRTLSSAEESKRARLSFVFRSIVLSFAVLHFS